MEEIRPTAFTQMNAKETAFALGYLPVHVLLMPWLLGKLYESGYDDMVMINVIYYAVAVVFLMAVLWKFFRRSFDALCDYGPAVILDILKAYGTMLLFNLGVALILVLAGRTVNPNNEAVLTIAGEDPGKAAAAAVFLAPIAEEAMFRGGVFGLLRRRSRIAAYAVSAVLFAFYHLWSYLAADATAWIYLLQYLPAGVILARCYEKTGSLWASIFLHMTVNGMSMLAISMMGELL